MALAQYIESDLAFFFNCEEFSDVCILHEKDDRDIEIPFIFDGSIDDRMQEAEFCYILVNYVNPIKRQSHIIIGREDWIVDAVKVHDKYVKQLTLRRNPTHWR